MLETVAVGVVTGPEGIAVFIRALCTADPEEDCHVLGGMLNGERTVFARIGPIALCLPLPEAAAFAGSLAAAAEPDEEDDPEHVPPPMIRERWLTFARAIGRMVDRVTTLPPPDVTQH